MATEIEWTDETWNPVTGCTRVSPGCANCYIERTPPFRMAGRVFARVGNEETTGVQLHPDRLEKPLRWRKPRRVFVCSLADLFHEEVPDDYLARVFAIMASAHEHTFQVLTKRPERALALLSQPFERDSFSWWAEHYVGHYFSPDYPVEWPLPNVWLGVSIENARYTWRADVLREIRAAVRFVSAEPLLGSLFVGESSTNGAHKSVDLRGIDWLIAGGESGPGARPMHPDWARELRDACLAEDYVAAGEVGRVGPAFFFKQWGEWAPIEGGGSTFRDVCLSPDGTSHEIGDSICAPNESDGTWLRKVGKKAAGRLLDGREWNEYPEART